VPSGEGAPLQNQSFSKTSGLIAMVAALVCLLANLVLAVLHPAIISLGFPAASAIGQFAGGFLVLAAFFGIAGLMRSGAAGEWRVTKFGLGFAFVSIAVLSLFSVFGGLDSIELHGLSRLMDGISLEITDWLLPAFLLLSLLGLLVAGVAVIRAKIWTGWKAYPMLSISLIPVLSIILLNPAYIPDSLETWMPVRAELSYWLGALFSLSWFALGVVLRTGTGQREPSVDQVLETSIA
jgi:hypothetical protein